VAYFSTPQITENTSPNTLPYIPQNEKIYASGSCAEVALTQLDLSIFN